MNLRLEHITNRIMKELKEKKVVLTLDKEYLGGQQFLRRIRKKDEPDFSKSILVVLCSYEDSTITIDTYNRGCNIHHVNSSVESVLKSNNLIFESIHEGGELIQNLDNNYIIYRDKTQLKNKREPNEIINEVLTQVDYICTEFPENYTRIIPLYLELRVAIDHEKFELAAKLKKKIEKITASSCQPDNLRRV